MWLRACFLFFIYVLPPVKAGKAPYSPNLSVFCPSLWALKGGDRVSLTVISQRWAQDLLGIRWYLLNSLMLEYHMASTTHKEASFFLPNNLMNTLRGSPPDCDGSAIKQISPDLVSNSKAGHWDLRNKTWRNIGKLFAVSSSLYNPANITKFQNVSFLLNFFFLK